MSACKKCNGIGYYFVPDETDLMGGSDIRCDECNTDARSKRYHREIKSLRAENKRLRDRWNSLREWVGYTESYDVRAANAMLMKMDELDQEAGE